MTTTLTLRDDNTSSDFVVENAVAADAFRALYDELVSRNDGDCAALIADGFVEDGGSFGKVLDMKHDAEAFWARLCNIMMNGCQDYEITR